MGKQISLVDIKKITSCAQETFNNQVFVKSCKDIDKAITFAADSGKSSTKFKLSDNELQIADRLMREYSEFKPTLEEYISSGSKFDDYDYHYFNFSW